MKGIYVCYFIPTCQFPAKRGVKYEMQLFDARKILPSLVPM